MFKWLHEHRTEGCTREAMDGAAEAGRLEVVKWLHANRTEGCTANAMGNNDTCIENLEIVQWLHEKYPDVIPTKRLVACDGYMRAVFDHVLGCGSVEYSRSFTRQPATAYCGLSASSCLSLKRVRVVDLDFALRLLLGRHSRNLPSSLYILATIFQTAVHLRATSCRLLLAGWAKSQEKATSIMETPTLERTFRGHKSAVTSVSFHPNMQQLASASVDCSVMIWNFRPQLRAFRFVGHKGPVYDVNFSPQGDLLASSSQDRTVRLWTPTVKGESVTVKAHAGAIRSVSFSYCAKELLTASDDMSIKIWSLPTRRFQCSLTGHSNWVRCARFSPDASKIASASDDKTVKFWDKEKRMCIQTFYEHAGIVNAVQFHPRDGNNTIASCSYDRSINMWDTRSAKLVQHYKAHDSNVTSIHFHPSGNYLVSTSIDNTIKIWDVREGQVLYTLHGHDGAVNCAEFSHDSKFIASGSVDSFVMVWEADLDKYLHVDAPKVVPSDSKGSANGVNTSSSSTSGRKPARISTAQADAAHSSASLYSLGSTSSRPRSPVQNGFSTSSAASPRKPMSMSPPPTPVQAPTPTQKSQYPGAASFYEVRPSGVFGLSPPKPSTSPAYATRSSSGGATNSGNASASDAQVQFQGSDNMAATLQHIVGQLEIITRTLSVLEERISLNEDRITDVTKMQKELLQRQRQQHIRKSYDHQQHEA